MKEIIIYKKNYEEIINSRILLQLDFCAIMDSLYELRCKIAHIRSYFTNSDFKFLVEESVKINNSLVNKNEVFSDFIEKINRNPEGLVIKTPVDFFVDEVSVFNYLPVADYEFEGGFVGRGEDVENIIKMMKSNRFHVITIAGAGGVGKSALVLKTVNEVIQRRDIEYDFVVWVSAKENKLSYLGIEDIEPTLRNYEELLDTILEVVGFDVDEYKNDIEKKEMDINTLFDSCDKVLIVIDNLETINDERIINFILDYHPNVYFMITSRKGLGQVERRYDLKELKDKDATHLFRVICREKNLYELQKADEKTILKYVKKVYCYPLAIKWVLGQAAMGKNISTITDTINEQSSDISRFCFEQVFSELNENAQLILYALCLGNDAVPQGILKYISNLDDEIFEDTVRELLLVSLILPEQHVNKESNEINSYYSLLPLTRGYVKVQLDKNGEIKEKLQERMITVENTLEEADRAKAQYRFSLSNFGAVTEEEKIAAMLAQTAYQKHQAGNYEDAVETFKKAKNIAPNFAPIYRNWAMIESMELHWAEADELMGKAAKLNPNDTQIWLVWGNMKRKNDKIKEAYGYYEKAYALSPKDNVVLNSYAQAISRLGDYERADKLFNEALEQVDGVPHNKHLIINYSSIAENLKKWAESYMKDRDYENAIDRLSEAKRAIEIVLELDKVDTKAQDIYADIWIMFGSIYDRLGEFNKAINMFENAAKCTNKSTRIKTLKKHASSVLRIASIYIKTQEYEQANILIFNEEKNIERVRDPKIIESHRQIKRKIMEAQSRKKGNVIRVDFIRKFMLIESDNCPGDVYIGFFNECKEFVSKENNPISKLVSFVPFDENGKKFAKSIMMDFG